MNFNEFEEIDYFNNLTNNNQNINNNLFSPYEGYIKGNIFKNLYDSYKNYKAKNININNEQDELLLNVNQLSFLRHELNLLLDNYPNNQYALNIFNHYLEEELNARKKYERRFGPLEILSNMESLPFKWEDDKWPWEI